MKSFYPISPELMRIYHDCLESYNNAAKPILDNLIIVELSVKCIYFQPWHGTIELVKQYTPEELKTIETAKETLKHLAEQCFKPWKEATKPIGD